MNEDLRTLYEPVEPFDSGRLPVGDGHEINYEQCGNPDGKPVVYLHGGPGGGFEIKHRGYFDPQAYRVVLFDQRGAGRSLPSAAVAGNTTPDLVADMERLRKYADIDRWMVFGGSWGSTLGLAYAEAHPERVTDLILRGIFLGRQAEIDWLYTSSGAAMFYPDLWGEFVAPIPDEERGNLLAAYHRRFFGPDTPERAVCARAWSMWEGSVGRLCPDRADIELYSTPDVALPFARIESHYFVNHCFLEEGQLLAQAQRIASLPGIIIQSHYDMVCPARSAHDLHLVWPASRLEIVPAAGHAASEPGVTDALIRATDDRR